MSTAEHRMRANRANSQKSTGPTTAEGKVIASQNALRHGLLSTKLLLEDEDPTEYEALLRGLVESLGPVGALEAHLIERIAVTLWRQRRLVHAETAGLSLGRKTRHTAELVSSELGRRYGRELQPQDLSPFDDEHAAWCRAVISEIEELGDVSVASVEIRDRPLISAPDFSEIIWQVRRSIGMQLKSRNEANVRRALVPRRILTLSLLPPAS